MSVLPPVAAAVPTRHDPETVYAQTFFSGCAAALSTLLNRSVTLELVPGMLSDNEALDAALPHPWVVASARFTRGLPGAHDLIFSQVEALSLTRLVLGDEEVGGDVFTAEHQDALRETVNQMFSLASSSLRVFFGKPVGIAPADLKQVEQADGWHPHAAAAIGVGVLTVDGTPRTRVALTIPATIREEVAVAQTTAQAPKAEAPPAPSPPGLDLILDIAMPVTVELGRTRMLIRDILALGPGSIVELDKLAGEPVDLLVNDRAIAKGEVVVIDENFGIRLTQIAQAAERLRSLG